MSDNRSQMSEGGRKGRAFYGEGGVYPFSQENESDRLRRERDRALFSGNYAEYGRLRDAATWAEKHNDDVIAKRQQDRDLDAEELDRTRSAGASPEEVARLGQRRDDGQKFRTDQRPRSTRLSTNIESGDSDHEFLEGKQGAKKWRKTTEL